MTNQSKIVGQIQPLPKRRRSEDNPYYLTLSIDSEGIRHYYVSFVDPIGETQHLEIDRLQFEAFDFFELEDLRMLNEKERHIDVFADIDDLLECGACAGPEEEAQERFNAEYELECLHKALDLLTDTQRRRLHMYYFQNMTYQEIALIEKCKIPSVCESMKIAKRNLRKIYENIFWGDPKK